MTDKWFDEFVYQVVIDKNDLGDLNETYESETKYTWLPPWDPMGALAK